MLNSTRLTFVRHGETAWNVDHRLQGHLDIPLNDTGRAQAQLPAAALGDEAFDALYSSDLGRALDTAAPLAERLALPVTPDPALRERHFGALQGLRPADAEHEHPELWQRYRGRALDWVPPGGESLADFAARIHTRLETLASQHHGQSLLLVTHGGVLEVIYRLATSTPLALPRAFPIPNAAIYRIERHPGGWRLLGWAERPHLEQARDEIL